MLLAWTDSERLSRLPCLSNSAPSLYIMLPALPASGGQRALDGGPWTVTLYFHAAESFKGFFYPFILFMPSLRAKPNQSLTATFTHGALTEKTCFHLTFPYYRQPRSAHHEASCPLDSTGFKAQKIYQLIPSMAFKQLEFGETISFFLSLSVSFTFCLSLSFPPMKLTCWCSWRNNQWEKSWSEGQH